MRKGQGGRCRFLEIPPKAAQHDQAQAEYMGTQQGTQLTSKPPILPAGTGLRRQERASGPFGESIGKPWQLIAERIFRSTPSIGRTDPWDRGRTAHVSELSLPLAAGPQLPQAFPPPADGGSALQCCPIETAQLRDAPICFGLHSFRNSVGLTRNICSKLRAKSREY